MRSLCRGIYPQTAISTAASFYAEVDLHASYHSGWFPKRLRLGGNIGSTYADDVAWCWLGSRARGRNRVGLSIRSPEMFIERLRWYDAHRKELAAIV
jgi:hypothetical protein